MIALEELDSHISESIKYNALSHRLSKMDEKDFDKMMKDGEDLAPIVVDHEAQIREAQRL